MSIYSHLKLAFHTMARSPVSPRKTPRQARSTATFDAILEAAAHILRDDGLAALTTNAVAERAGASIGSLYQYFPNKNAILSELIRQRRQTMLNEIRATLHPPGRVSFSRMVDGMIAAGITHQLDDPAVSRALEYAEAILPIEAETEALNAAIVKEVTDLLTMKGIADPHIVAQDIAALSRGMIDAAGLNGETDANYLTERVKRAVTGYLRTTPKRD